jgi:septum formation protein
LFVLASQSPRRLELLRQLLGPDGDPHAIPIQQIAPAEGPQAEALEAVRPSEAPDAYVQRVTLAKLVSARHRCQALGFSGTTVLCADTTVAVGRRILGKPVDDEETRTMLRRLSGRSHRVYTAVAVAQGLRQGIVLSTTRVWVEPLSDAQIDRYVASGESTGKAGAYAIQGRFAAHVQRIEGSYSGVMGLPLHETARLLAQIDCHGLSATL